MNHFQEWAAWQRAAGLSPRTVEERAVTIAALLASSGVEGHELMPLHIATFLGREHLSQASRATYYGAIRAYCRFLQAIGARSDDPCALIPAPRRRPSVPRPVSDAQLEGILAACNRRRTRCYVLLAAYQGLRVHEVAKIRGEDIDIAAGTLRVIGKGAREAVLPLHPVIAREARQWPRAGYWFPGRTSAHVTGQGVGQAIQSAMTRAGVSGTPHMLRHWFGTRLVAEGVHLRVVQELMRHASPTTTAGYTLVRPEQMRAGLERIAA